MLLAMTKYVTPDKMYKRFIFIFIFIFIPPLIIALLIPSGVYARQMRIFSSLPRTETVEKDYFSAGDKLDLSGVVNGDAYLDGGAITLDGTVNWRSFSAGRYGDSKRRDNPKCKGY